MTNIFQDQKNSKYELYTLEEKKIDFFDNNSIKTSKDIKIHDYDNLYIKKKIKPSFINNINNSTDIFWNPVFSVNNFQTYLSELEIAKIIFKK